MQEKENSINSDNEQTELQNLTNRMKQKATKSDKSTEIDFTLDSDPSFINFMREYKKDQKMLKKHYQKKLKKYYSKALLGNKIDHLRLEKKNKEKSFSNEILEELSQNISNNKLVPVSTDSKKSVTYYFDMDKKETLNFKPNVRGYPLSFSTYRLLIQAAEGSNYRAIRLRVMICLLALTGIRLKDLLPIKVNQIETLVSSYSLKIPGLNDNDSVFLNDKGKQLLNAQKKDFEFLFLMKKPSSYVFTSISQDYKMLSRETISKDLNRVLLSVSKSLPENNYLTIYSFQTGFNANLWENFSDIIVIKELFKS